MNATLEKVKVLCVTRLYVVRLALRMKKWKFIFHFQSDTKELRFGEGKQRSLWLLLILGDWGEGYFHFLRPCGEDTLQKSKVIWWRVSCPKKIDLQAFSDDMVITMRYFSLLKGKFANWGHFAFFFHFMQFPSCWLLAWMGGWMDGWIMVIMELLFTEQTCYFFATKLEAQLWTNKSQNSQTQEPLSFGYSCSTSFFTCL